MLREYADEGAAHLAEKVEGDLGGIRRLVPPTQFCVFDGQMPVQICLMLPVVQFASQGERHFISVQGLGVLAAASIDVAEIGEGDFLLETVAGGAGLG